jgi:hypothetical protein
MKSNNTKFFYSVGEAMAWIKNKFSYLTNVANEFEAIENKLNEKQVATVEGYTIFIDELHLLD